MVALKRTKRRDVKKLREEPTSGETGYERGGGPQTGVKEWGKTTWQNKGIRVNKTL